MARKSLLVVIVLLALLVVNVLPALAQDDEFVFGVVLVGPKNDGGWSQAHYEAGQKIEETMPGTKMLLFESLNTADAPETTLLDVATDMVSQGAKVIFTTSDEFEEDTDTVAAQFPDVVFINDTGSRVLEEKSPDNVGNINGQLEWTKAISGCAAGLATKSGKIGYLGALINAETRRLAAATYLGARYCYEKYAGGDPANLEFTVTWIGFWFNIPGFTLDPTAESNTFVDNGADVLISGIDTTETLTVADQKTKEGTPVFGIAQDNANGCDAAPTICLGVPYYNWYPLYRDVINQVKDGSWEPSWQWFAPDFKDINDPETSAVGFKVGTALTEEQLANLNDYIATMSEFGSNPDNAESIFPWVGPLNLQDGTELAPDGENVALLDIWYLPQLLEGMTGTSSTQS
jgi:simple sugar transport system substrate-binding protein